MTSLGTFITIITHILQMRRKKSGTLQNSSKMESKDRLILAQENLSPGTVFPQYPFSMNVFKTQRECGIPTFCTKVNLFKNSILQKLFEAPHALPKISELAGVQATAELRFGHFGNCLQYSCRHIPGEHF